MTDPTRRDVLKHTLGASLFFGFSSWSALAKDGPQPGALEAAKAVMKRTKRHGVALVIPSDAKARKAFVAALSTLFPVVNGHQGAPALARYLVEHVWVCVDAAAVGAKKGETVVFLDPQGKRIDGSKLDLSDAKVVGAGLATLLDGSGRLAKRAKAARTKAVEAALNGLADKDWQKQYWVLRRMMPAALPAVLAAAGAPKAHVNVKNLARDALKALYWSSIQKTAQFPFGVTWKVEMSVPEPCPPCGMAAPSIKARRFLDFVSKPK